MVWEESIIMMPKTARFVFLSATIPNAREFAEWIATIHRRAPLPSLQTRVSPGLNFWLGAFLRKVQASGMSADRNPPCRRAIRTLSRAAGRGNCAKGVSHASSTCGNRSKLYPGR